MGNHQTETLFNSIYSLPRRMYLTNERISAIGKKSNRTKEEADPSSFALFQEFLAWKTSQEP